jgi:hypothetical protein
MRVNIVAMSRRQSTPHTHNIPPDLLSLIQSTSQPGAAIYIDEKKASFLTGYSAAFFRKRRLLESGPPYRKVGRSIRYNVLEIVQWMEAQACYPKQGISGK